MLNDPMHGFELLGKHLARLYFKTDSVAETALRV